MRHTDAEQGSSDFNRRDFIRNTSFGTLMMLMGGVPLEAAEAPAAGEQLRRIPLRHHAATSGLRVIGCGLGAARLSRHLACW